MCRTGPAQNLRSRSNETRLFITILSSSKHDDLCDGIENVNVHVLPHTPGDIFVWSLNNSAESHVASKCANAIENSSVFFEPLGNVVRQLQHANSFSMVFCLLEASALQVGNLLACSAGEHWETPVNAGDPKRWQWLKFNEVSHTLRISTN